MKISIYSIVLPRLEVPFLDEWIEYHVNLGVDEIYLYNNGLLPVHDSGAHWRKNGPKAPAQKKRMKALSKISDKEKPYIWEKKPAANYNFHLSDEEIMQRFYYLQVKWPQVKIVEWVKGEDHNFGYPTSQEEGFYHFVENFKTDWVLFIDPDEFVTLNKKLDHCKNLKSFIRFHKSYKMFSFPPIRAPKRKIGEKNTENFPRRVFWKTRWVDPKWLGKITNRSDVIAYPICHTVKIKDRKYTSRKKVLFEGSSNPEIAFFHCK